MTTNFKLYIKYIFLKFDFFFVKNKIRNDKNTTLIITPEALYYLSLHFKLSSLFRTLQLTEIFSYELPLKTTSAIDNLLVYNFHSLIDQQRFFVFVCRNTQSVKKNSLYLSSITELFLNANWLEREVSELHGLFFAGKKDLRNLMLQYGDKSAPFQKSFPTIGTKEIFYDVTNDLLVQTPVSLQF